MYKNRIVEYIVLVLSIAFVWLYFFLGFEGYYGWDDMEYAQLSYQWAKGTFDLSQNHFSYRHPVILFTGISYKLFGVNDFSSALPAIILSSIILIMVFIVLYKTDTRVLITALVLTLLMPPFILYSHKLMSDLYVAVGIFGAFVAYYFYRFRLKKWSVLWGFLFAGSLFFAFLAKEVVVLIVPVLIALLIADMLSKQQFTFWASSFISGLLMFISYHLLIWEYTGSPLSRYEAIEANAYLNPCSYEHYDFIYTVKRIAYEFWNEALLSGLMIVAVFMLPYLFKRTRRYWFSKPESFWINIAFIALLSANFMTKSYQAYSPMCLDMRHYLYLVPLISIASAPTIVRYFFSVSRNWWIVALIVILTSIYSYQYFTNIKTGNSVFVYTVWSVFLLVIIRIIRKNWKVFSSSTLWILFLAAWLIFPTNQMIKLQQQPFHKHIPEFIEKHFANIHQPTLVLTDAIMKRIANYYMKWDSTYVRFIDERSPQIPYADETNDYLIYHNNLTWWFLDRKKPEPMLLWYFEEPNIQLIDSVGGNYLYKIVKPENIHRPVDTLVIYTDFENVNPVLSTDASQIDSLVRYSGKKSCRLVAHGFAATFTKPLKDFVTAKTSKLEIEFSTNILYKSAINTQFVVNVTDSAGNHDFWLGKPFKELITPSSSWQKVHSAISYQPKDNFSKLTLKTYFWNDDNMDVWIDNVLIKIIRIEHL